MDKIIEEEGKTAMVKVLATVVTAPILIVGLYIVTIPLTSLVFAWLIKWTWNYTLPILFGLPTITYWQAYALDLLVCYLGLRKVTTTQ